VEHGVSGDAGSVRVTLSESIAVKPEESISRKTEEARGLTAAKLSGFPIDPEIHPLGISDVLITGKKLETRLDLTLWIIESLVGNP
jgi:hypothetical protein